MAPPRSAPPSRRGTVLLLLLVIAVMAGIWYYFLGPGVNGPWPWEAHFRLPRLWNRR